MASQDELVQRVLIFKRKLTAVPRLGNSKVMKLLHKLSNLDITVEILQVTGIGKVVNNLRKVDPDIAELAKPLIQKWKNLVKEAMAAEKEMDGSESSSPEKYRRKKDKAGGISPFAEIMKDNADDRARSIQEGSKDPLETFCPMSNVQVKVEPEDDLAARKSTLEKGHKRKSNDEESSLSNSEKPKFDKRMNGMTRKRFKNLDDDIKEEKESEDSHKIGISVKTETPDEPTNKDSAVKIDVPSESKNAYPRQSHLADDFKMSSKPELFPVPLNRKSAFPPYLPRVHTSSEDDCADDESRLRLATGEEVTPPRISVPKPPRPKVSSASSNITDLYGHHYENKHRRYPDDKLIDKQFDNKRSSMYDSLVKKVVKLPPRMDQCLMLEEDVEPQKETNQDAGFSIYSAENPEDLVSDMNSFSNILKQIKQTSSSRERTIVKPEILRERTAIKLESLRERTAVKPEQSKFLKKYELDLSRSIKQDDSDHGVKIKKEEVEVAEETPKIISYPKIACKPKQKVIESLDSLFAPDDAVTVSLKKTPTPKIYSKRPSPAMKKSSISLEKSQKAHESFTDLLPSQNNKIDRKPKGKDCSSQMKIKQGLEKRLASRMLDELSDSDEELNKHTWSPVEARLDDTSTNDLNVSGSVLSDSEDELSDDVSNGRSLDKRSEYKSSLKKHEKCTKDRSKSSDRKSHHFNSNYKTKRKHYDSHMVKDNDELHSAHRKAESQKSKGGDQCNKPEKRKLNSDKSVTNSAKKKALCLPSDRYDSKGLGIEGEILNGALDASVYDNADMQKLADVKVKSEPKRHSKKSSEHKRREKTKSEAHKKLKPNHTSSVKIKMEPGIDRNESSAEESLDHKSKLKEKTARSETPTKLKSEHRPPSQVKVEKEPGSEKFEPSSNFLSSGPVHPNLKKHPGKVFKKKKVKKLITSNFGDSGLSFEDSLFSVGPAKKPKALEGTEKPYHASERDSFQSSKTSSSKTSKAFAEGSKSSKLSSSKDIKKEMDSPKIKVTDRKKPTTVDSTDILKLPVLTPDYKPLPEIVSPERRKVPTPSESMPFQWFGSKSNKTKVFSGRTRGSYWTRVPTLQAICRETILDNIERVCQADSHHPTVYAVFPREHLEIARNEMLEDVGGIPFYILESVLERCSAEQLLRIEDYNPDFILESDHLWKHHVEKTFKNVQREEMESWREVYLRMKDEREYKLKAITANINKAMAERNPGRLTKLAYLDSVAKPPRNVRRQQMKHGISNSAHRHSSSSSSGQRADRGMVIQPISRPTPSAPSDQSVHPESPERIPVGNRGPRAVKVIAPMMKKSLKLMNKIKKRR